VQDAEVEQINAGYPSFVGPIYQPGKASMGYWPINRRCANKLCAYGNPVSCVKS